MSLFQRTFHRLRPTVPRHSAILTRGLEEFFEANTTTSVPVKEVPAGRSWEASELRKKSFDDLHKLWYVLLKERNLLATQKQEAKRLKVNFLHDDRVSKVKKSMARIKQVLSERQTAYDGALAELEARRLREEIVTMQASADALATPPPAAAIQKRIEQKRAKVIAKDKARQEQAAKDKVDQ